ncbi:DNA polymerase delta, subunit 4-domain-containing protein [Tricladium varicosporioides]|nr:DNA polymerase delta, subunit 4-domain-containing protein [Hymenoscyphus varicosporioides]
MPPKRSTRHSSGPATRGSQKTLAFSSSKISKPSTPTTTTSQKSKLAQSISSLAPEDIDTKDVGHISSEAAITQQAEAEVERVVKEERTEEEERAARVTDAQIRRYWRERESERRAPRVHQQELGVEEKVLRLFDISSQYGPCIGIARMKRWVRANKLGLNPPIEVLAVLLKEEEKGNTKIERAHVDELMSSKFIIEEA